MATHNFRRFAIGLSFLTILSLSASGCATIGQNFSAIHVAEIKIGKTTQREIRKMFGSPWLSGVQNGERSWTYGIYEYSLFGERKAKDLVVQFDEKGLVTSFTYSTTEHSE